MVTKQSAVTSDEVCTTQVAAQMLGVSVSLVQQLVETGVLDAWKTQGGHRRIPIKAVLDYKHKLAGSMGRDAGGRATILVIEDNAIQRALYQRQFAAWDLPADFIFCENGYQALLQIARRPPDILLADIVMEGIDGFEVVRTVMTDPELADVSIAILSGLPADELAARGGVPEGVVFFPKPINYDELRGYLRASVAQRARKPGPM
ncbi:response regulator [Massilia aurea]|uniref:response regulator n=1 Tax=Massilia aurea TaxID=373040 RepID=UPI0021626F37|nr:response regulator [Massilia aurea]